MDRYERGFTLIEVVVAVALFAFVALTAFEVLRALQGGVLLVGQRADAAASLEALAGELRSKALSSVAVFKPPSSCGDALEFLEHNAVGTSFTVYVARTSGGTTSLLRSDGSGPLDPCDPALSVDTVLSAIDGFTVTVLAASDLPNHLDPIGGQPDGGLFLASGITTVEANSYALDFDQKPIATGNDVVEVQLDADPVSTLVDLSAGNRPSGFTQQLAYPCNGRCEANTPFPEVRGGTYTDCAVSIAFANTLAYYVPASYALVPVGTNQQQIVITAYFVTGGYLFAFNGPTPLTVARDWPVATWPPAGSALAGTIADSYPLNYAANSVAARGAAQVALDLGEPSAFAAELGACGDLDAERGNLFE